MILFQDVPEGITRGTDLGGDRRSRTNESQFSVPVGPGNGAHVTIAVPSRLELRLKRAPSVADNHKHIILERERAIAYVTPEHKPGELPLAVGR